MIRNSILDNIFLNQASENENPLRIKFQNCCREGGGTYFRRIVPTGTNNYKGHPKIARGTILKTQINQADS